MSVEPTEPGVHNRIELERCIAATMGSSTEARWLLEETTERSGPLSPEQVAKATRLAERRRGGEPLQYILGHWPFRDLDLLVDARALIPRPETEWVTEVALAELDRLLADGAAPLVVELGTGTGAIALSIATERADHDVCVMATDHDGPALELARQNQRRVSARPGAERVSFRHGSWWRPVDPSVRGQVALVVSNPPYVAVAEWELLDPVVRDHEPYGALVANSGRDGTPGFAAIEAVLGQAGHWLAHPGVAVIEIGPTQGDAAVSCARAAGCSHASVLADLANRPRALVARFG